jgi:hypothetical protein
MREMIMTSSQLKSRELNNYDLELAAEVFALKL